MIAGAPGPAAVRCCTAASSGTAERRPACAGDRSAGVPDASRRCAAAAYDAAQAAPLPGRGARRSRPANGRAQVGEHGARRPFVSGVELDDASRRIDVCGAEVVRDLGRAVAGTNHADAEPAGEPIDGQPIAGQEGPTAGVGLATAACARSTAGVSCSGSKDTETSRTWPWSAASSATARWIVAKF